MRPFEFLNGPWENSELPTIVKDDPAGGDPHILAVLKRVHNPDALYDLCRLANDSIERSGKERAALEGLLEACRQLSFMRKGPAVDLLAQRMAEASTALRFR